MSIAVLTPSQNESTPAEKQQRTLVGSLLAVCFPLYVILALAKSATAQLAWFPNVKFVVRETLDCISLSFEDLLYVLAIALVFYLPLRLTTRYRRMHRAVWISLLALNTLNVFYSIVNIQICNILGTPLTLQLIRMTGDIKAMRSSTASFITPGLVALLALAPVAYLFGAWIAVRSGVFEKKKIRRYMVIIFVLYCIGEPIGYSRVVNNARNTLARNPVCHFIMSCSERFSGRDTPALDATPPVAFYADFQTVAERPQTADPAPETPRRMNVILFVLESINTHYMSLHGSQYPTTPNLIAEAHNSLIFDNIYSHAGYSAHSLIPLTISIYPGMGWRIYVTDFPELIGTSTAQVLTSRGYRTAFLGAQDLNYQNFWSYLNSRGFDVVKDYHSFGAGLRLTGWGGDDRELVTGMLQWIDEKPHQPFFLMSWTQQTHHPYALGPGQATLDMTHDSSSRAMRDLNRFLNAVRVTDEQIERLMTGLRERGIADDTLVVLTGDHGEAFGEPHGFYTHGTSLYDESVHVPLIFINAKLFSPGKRVATVGGHVDVNPTILDILGIQPPGNWQGTSLLDPSHTQRTYFATTAAAYLMGLRDLNWKFIYNATFGLEELYDLSNDPKELTNLAKKRPDLCTFYRGRLSAWMRYEKTHMAELIGEKQ